MVHLRLNEKETNPNPHVNFITALKSSTDEEEDARQLLRALAAQVKPVMKAHGFSVNSFEEYEHNRVFLGRNWNNGETVELVLRRADGSFYPTYWLMDTLCHELAHIKHMNHGRDFQALWSLLRIEVRQLQDRGYYGDGYWSSGQRLRDSARIGNDVLGTDDFPEHLCGGAQSRTRPNSRRRRYMPRGRRHEVVPSLHTGAQTAKKRKPGARVTSKYAFAGEGTTLDSGSDRGTGFGKQASSKRAREERAHAIEKRLSALTSGPQAASPEIKDENSDEEEEESKFIPETDAERRQALLDATQSDDAPHDLDSGFSWTKFEDAFNFEGFPSPQPNGSEGASSVSTVDFPLKVEDTASCSIPIASGSSSTIGTLETSNKGKRKASMPTENPKPSKKSGHLGLGKMVNTEIDHRKKESLGMAPIKGAGRRLGSGPSPYLPLIFGTAKETQTKASPSQGAWNCLVCTLENQPSHLSCLACGTPKNESKWRGDT